MKRQLRAQVHVVTMHETPKRLVALIALVLGLGVVVSQPPVAPAQQVQEDQSDFGGDSMVSGGSSTDIDPAVTTPTDSEPATRVSEPTTDSAGSATSAAGVSEPADTSATSTTSPTDGSTAQLSASGEPRAIAQAAQSSVLLGTVESVAVLAGSAVTNTGPSVISGDVDVAPACAVSGFPPGIVINGTIHRCDAVAAQAQADLTTAYNDAAGRTPTQQVATELGGQTLTTGVYRSASGTFGITGPLTLNAQGDPNAVFIFQTESTLITASASRVVLINGAQACNVFWQVGSSATLGTDSDFVGNILALTSITANTGATVDGRLLARNGAVTLDTNTITRSVCATAVDETP
ncbi:MAG: ice-binding family protein, partial [Actinomycetota bacterium]|nr:ice-binding family protein [Actinomycetota bacterium]